MPELLFQGLDSEQGKADCLWGSTLLSPGGSWPLVLSLLALNWFVPAAMALIYLSLSAGAFCPNSWQNSPFFIAGTEQKGYLGKFIPCWRCLGSLAHQQDKRLEPRFPVTVLLLPTLGSQSKAQIGI